MSVRVSAFPFPFPVSQSVVSLSDSDLSKRSDVKGRKGMRRSALCSAKGGEGRAGRRERERERAGAGRSVRAREEGDVTS